MVAPVRRREGQGGREPLGGLVIQSAWPLGQGAVWPVLSPRTWESLAGAEC